MVVHHCFRNNSHRLECHDCLDYVVKDKSHDVQRVALENILR